MKVTIIGAGNLSWSLIPNLQRIGLDVIQIISRTPEKRHRFAKAYGIPLAHKSLKDLSSKAELVVLSVGDHAIAPLAVELARFASPHQYFVHTSGSISLDALSPLGANVGVFYPMQIFTQAVVTSYEHVPLFLEAPDSLYPILLEIANQLTNKVYRFNSEERLCLHLGAVIVCNFTNYLYRIAQTISPLDTESPIEIYKPLIEEHLQKVFRFNPENTQTGPAIRADYSTLNKHLKLLQHDPPIQKLYLEISNLINPSLCEELIDPNTSKTV